MRLHHLHHFRVRNGVTFASDIVIPASAGFLTKTTFFAEQISRFAVLHVWFFEVPALTNGKTNVVARQITHAKRAHGKTKLFDSLVDLGGCTSFIEQKATLTAVLLNHAVADKAVADT